MDNKSVEDDILKKTGGTPHEPRSQINSEMGTRNQSIDENDQQNKLKFRPVSKKNSSNQEVTKAKDGTPAGSRLELNRSAARKDSQKLAERKNSAGHLSLNADSSKSKGSQNNI